MMSLAGEFFSGGIDVLTEAGQCRAGPCAHKDPAVNHRMLFDVFKEFDERGGWSRREEKWCVESRSRLCRNTVERVGKNRLFVGIVLIERAAIDASPLRDVAHGDEVKVALMSQLKERLLEALARAFNPDVHAEYGATP